MAKGRIKEEDRKNQGWPRPNKLRTFEHVYGPCNSNICDQTAKILIFKRCDICQYLDSVEDISMTTSPINSIESCYTLENDRARTVVGFYIKPKLPNLDDDNNNLEFQAIYAEQYGNNYTEFVDVFQSIDPYRVGISSSGDPLVTLTPYNGIINHNIFQFNDDAIDKDFMKAYISWYELKCIVENCEYVGVLGSLVMTGNIGNLDINGRPIRVCNTAYFTYRFIGFNLYSGSPGEIGAKLIPSNIVEKNGEFITDYNIPTVSWATPCPPMWI